MPRSSDPHMAFAGRRPFPPLLLPLLLLSLVVTLFPTLSVGLPSSSSPHPSPLSTTSSSSSLAPNGLLCDFQKTPALGVRAVPRFTWIVPPCAGSANQMQTAYEIVVTKVFDGSVVWNSGKQLGSDSTYVAYAGAPLSPSTAYGWTVTTWTDTCQSDVSAPATFVTSLLDAGWAPATQFITTTATQNTFGYFRKEIAVPAEGVVSAVVHVTALVNDYLLSGFKFYINDQLIGLGPGRAEAPVWSDAVNPGLFREITYSTFDVTSAFSSASGSSGSSNAVLALQAMFNAPPTVILQLTLYLRQGGNVTIVSDSTWQAFNGDVHRNPGPATHGSSAGTKFLEYIDARNEPVGWRAQGFVPGAGWANAVAFAPSPAQVSNFHARMQPPITVTELVPVQSIRPIPTPSPPPTHPVTCGIVQENEVLPLGGCPDATPLIADVVFASYGTPQGSCRFGFSKGACDAATTLSIVKAQCVGKKECSIQANNGVFGDPCYDTAKQLAVQIKCSGGPAPPPPPGPPPLDPQSFLADFGKESQGGLRLDVANGVAGETVSIACGESLQGNTVGYTWGWEFTWTLRAGAQVLEQHKYMECRFVTITFSWPAPNFTLSHWVVNYPWSEEDSTFSSSNATLDAVYNLCRYTVHAVALDTYTDSNTRERTPYEADGLIAATSRIMVQRDYLFPRHSHAYVIQHPTWPVEWQQESVFLGWQDYQATGQPDLSLAFMQEMFDRTKISFLDATGLLKTNNMGSHIVDWMPNGSESDQTVALGEFTASDHMSVTNALAGRGLGLLATMMTAGGRVQNATRFANASSSLLAAITKFMWNGTAYCDGVCSEVQGKSLVMTNMFTLALGMVPPANVPSVWSTVADWGLEKMGDYGAFWYQMAISSGYYAPHYDTPDDGTAIHTALTKCDTFSWCSGLRDDNLTMTRESWHDGTYSHGWGSSAVSGVTWGVMGVHQLSPAFATFIVKPKIGPLSHASITVPTLRGYINATATPGALDIQVPCNTLATLCIPRSAADAGRIYTRATSALLLDDVEVEAVDSGLHLCAAKSVGCGAHGATRRLRVQSRV